MSQQPTLGIVMLGKDGKNCSEAQTNATVSKGASQAPYRWLENTTHKM
jgi:hypothetical protein